MALALAGAWLPGVVTPSPPAPLLTLTCYNSSPCRQTLLHDELGRYTATPFRTSTHTHIYISIKIVWKVDRLLDARLIGLIAPLECLLYWHWHISSWFSASGMCPCPVSWKRRTRGGSERKKGRWPGACPLPVLSRTRCILYILVLNWWWCWYSQKCRLLLFRVVHCSRRVLYLVLTLKHCVVGSGEGGEGTNKCSV